MATEKTFKPQKWVVVGGGMLVIAVILAVFREPSVNSKPLPPRNIDNKSPIAKEAARVFRGQSCAACHFIPGYWNTDGVALNAASAKYDPAQLKRLIRTPQSVNPNATMPNQPYILETNLNAIVGFLSQLPTEIVTNVTVVTVKH